MEPEKKLTAVEWLVNHFDECGIDYGFFQRLINHAKEKEKQQIIEAFNDASLEGEKMGIIYYETEFKKK